MVLQRVYGDDKTEVQFLMIMVKIATLLTMMLLSVLAVSNAVLLSNNDNEIAWKLDIEPNIIHLMLLPMHF
jgi:hypothetical protein